MAIAELLEYQNKIDVETARKRRNKQDRRQKALKEIYREASRRFHPDVNKSVEAEKIMKQVNAFYENGDYHSIKNLMNKATHTI
jgi:hypothetical protein